MADQVEPVRFERGDIAVTREVVDGELLLVIEDIRDGYDDRRVTMTEDEAYWLFFVAGPAAMPDKPSAREQRGR